MKNKTLRIIGIWLIVSGAFGIMSFSVSIQTAVIGVLLVCAGIVMIKEHPKLRDNISQQVPVSSGAIAPTRSSSKYTFSPRDYQAMNKFLAPLSNVPYCQISAKGEYVKPMLVKDLTSFPHTNITRSTSSDKYFRFIAIDVETTGLNATCEIIEVSAIKWVGNEPVEIFTSLCRSNSPIPQEVSKINHITDDMIADAPYFYNILPELQEFISDFPLVGHNIDFDLKFLQRYGVDFGQKRYIFDTLDLAHKNIKKDNGGDYSDDRISDYKLGTVCRFLNIDCPIMHRSLCDAYATSLVFFKLISRIVS